MKVKDFSFALGGIVKLPWEDNFNGKILQLCSIRKTDCPRPNDIVITEYVGEQITFKRVKDPCSREASNGTKILPFRIECIMETDRTLGKEL